MKTLGAILLAFTLSLSVSCSKDGLDGLQGIQGIQGEKGDKGEKGDRGENGADGASGGRDGTNGTDGRDGADGAQGEQGEAGADGADGVDGTDGLNGRDGIDGVGLVYVAALDANPSLTCTGEIVRITYGWDLDGDHNVDEAEVKGHFFWCRTSPDIALVHRSEKASIDKCINGGNVIVFAEDTNGDGGVSDGDEVINILTVCK